jgi:hypothetical protein
MDQNLARRSWSDVGNPYGPRDEHRSVDSPTGEPCNIEHTDNEASTDQTAVETEIPLHNLIAGDAFSEVCQDVNNRDNSPMGDCSGNITLCELEKQESVDDPSEKACDLEHTESKTSYDQTMVKSEIPLHKLIAVDASHEVRQCVNKRDNSPAGDCARKDTLCAGNANIGTGCDRPSCKEKDDVKLETLTHEETAGETSQGVCGHVKQSKYSLHNDCRSRRSVNDGSAQVSCKETDAVNFIETLSHGETTGDTSEETHSHVKRSKNSLEHDHCSGLAVHKSSVQVRVSACTRLRSDKISGPVGNQPDEISLIDARKIDCDGRVLRKRHLSNCRDNELNQFKCDKSR